MRRPLASRLAFVLSLASALPAAGQTSAATAGDAAGPRATPGVEAPVDVHAIPPDSYRATAARLPEGRAPRIDGRLDDEVWALAPAHGAFIQREPRFGYLTTEPTEFRILYDDKRLYIGIWAYDSDPAGIRASELKRDSGLSKGDQIKIVLDTFHDHRNAYYFSTNPLGAFKDAHMVDNGRTINYDWNAVWENRTSIDARGWYVEIAVPLNQLRFNGSPGETAWGLNVCRIIARKNEETYWVPFPREWNAIGFARLSNAGLLTGLHGLESRRRLELVPYVSPRVSEDRANRLPRHADTGYGLDARVGLTSNLVADLTYKTDFAQVEADQEVVNLSRFSLFFPEKRQFFTESAAVFDYGQVGTSRTGGDAAAEAGLLQLFYSRRIGLDEGRQVPIVGGGKLTGRAGRYSLGVMNVVTDATRQRVDSETERVVPRANYTVGRIKRDVLSQSSVGLIFTNRQGGAGADYNRALGIDAGLNLGRALNVSGFLAKTFSPETSGADVAGAVDVAWRSDRFSHGATYLDVGSRFNPEMGFVVRRDIRNWRGRAAWTPRPRWPGVRQVTLGASVNYFETHDGVVDSRTEQAEFVVQRQDSSSVRFTAIREYDLLPSTFTVGAGAIAPGEYGWTAWRVNYVSNASRRVYGSATVERGGYYDGEKATYRAALNFVLKDTLLIEPNFTVNVIDLPDRPTYTTNTLNTRVSYSFSPDLFVKGFAQYNSDRQIATFNALLWYVYRPGSDLYVVYEHGWDTDLPGPASTRTRSRSLAVKMTYWLAR